MSVLRKILIGLVSLAVLVWIFVLYSRSTRRPPSEFSTAPGAVDSNFARITGQGGRIGDVQIPLLKNPVYQDRDENGTIIREFGFSQLVRAVGDVWEVDEPWMKVHQRKSTFEIRADTGTTELETIVGRSTPKDAMFAGNVVIKIVPKGQGPYKQTSIFLDNLIFTSDRARFSTPGPVRLVSEDVRLVGRGLEFVYNDITERLEYLRLSELQSLHITGQASLSLSGARPRHNGSADESTVPETTAERPGPPAQSSPGTAPSPAENTTPRPDAEYYKCILSKNVLIETPKHVAFAGDAVLIKDILWSKGALEASEPNVSGGAEAGGQGQGPRPNPPAEPPAPEPEIVVTCDNGLLLAPMNSRRTLEDFRSAEAPPRRPEQLNDPGGRATFSAENIEYSALTRRAAAHGPSELIFFSGEVAAADPNRRGVPVKVTSKSGASFSSAANQAVFEGDCLCTMPQEELSQRRDVTLSASRLTVNLPQGRPAADNPAPEVIAHGPVEVTFYVEDPNAARPKKPPVPVKVTAEDHARFIPDANQVIFDGNCVCTMPQGELSGEHNFTLESRRLIANLPARKPDAGSAPDVLAEGPVKLGFYIDSFGTGPAAAQPLPATVTAAKQAHFLPARNKILFEGDCKSLVVRKEPNYVEEYILSSERIVVDLPAESNAPASAAKQRIEHLSAYGGAVTLATKKTAGGSLLSGIELICRRFDYDPHRQLYIAEGPGLIKFANVRVPDANDTASGFSLDKPCWAIIENYDKLEYYPSKNKITAQAGPEGALLVQYFPIKNGKFTDHIVVTADRVEASLLAGRDRRTDLATLTASGGITYQAKGNEFIGGELFYDHARALVKVRGSQAFPCRFNGALVDQIKYDIKADKVKAELVGPGALQVK